MRMVRVRLDEDLLVAVDRAAKRLGMTRSAFTRQAVPPGVLVLPHAELPLPDWLPQVPLPMLPLHLP